jgi:hypothetical protein
MKKCAKTVHIITWLLVLLTLQHHYIQCTNNFLNFDDLFAPIYWCNCASSTNRRRHTNILKIKKFADFLNVSSTNVLVLTGYQHQYIGAVRGESKF